MNTHSLTIVLACLTAGAVAAEKIAPASGPVIDVPALASSQLKLCMIGDSVTWAGDGDFFRKYLLEHIPNLAFIGTHTAKLGFSHAGEGGNTTRSVLSRIDDPERIPNAPFYHLLIGINDSAAAKKEADLNTVPAGTSARIVQIVQKLLDRPDTRKVFLASILPSPFDPKTGESTFRDKAGSRTNSILRRDFKSLFPDGRVVWLEYEKPLRNMGADWKNPKYLNGCHPTEEGYKILAAIAAPLLQHEMTLTTPKADKYGVEVVNLWDAANNTTQPLIPGWYVISFNIPDDAAATMPSVIKLTLRTEGDNLKFKANIPLTATRNANGRYEACFMTGYEGYGYSRAPFHLSLDPQYPPITRLQVEKMRPSRKASTFTASSCIDSSSPVYHGENIVPAP